MGGAATGGRGSHRWEGQPQVGGAEEDMYIPHMRTGQINIKTIPTYVQQEVRRLCLMKR